MLFIQLFRGIGFFNCNPIVCPHFSIKYGLKIWFSVFSFRVEALRVAGEFYVWVRALYEGEGFGGWFLFMRAICFLRYIEGAIMPSMFYGKGQLYFVFCPSYWEQWFEEKKRHRASMMDVTMNRGKHIIEMTSVLCEEKLSSIESTLSRTRDASIHATRRYISPANGRRSSVIFMR